MRRPNYSDPKTSSICENCFRTSCSCEACETVRTPVILAGGLGPDNVIAAILAVKPAGVDSKTRTDLGDTHSKDLSKVAAFNKAAKGAALV